MMRLSEKRILQNAINFSQIVKQQLAESAKTSEASVQKDVAGVTPGEQEATVNGDVEQTELNKETIPSEQLNHQTQEKADFETTETVTQPGSGEGVCRTTGDQCSDKEGTVKAEQEM